ncbi:polysaccharide biosynthesis tyrosine autokinase [uncultured Bacteroides sp.]|uniref:GumC family protein n=1 Tax=uncultured Bacteroides sp. TaxID=162156 RepID=UPI00280B0BAC|nr:polysaccharide biosynthesis tyrosine autokinase [uncultured Bacteroides sp.]
MAEDFNNYQLEDEETSGFDYKAFFFKLLMYWPWIVGCVLVALIGAFFYLKTLTPLYTVNSSVLIKDDKGKAGSNEASLADLGFVTSSTQNFDNELEILRSRTLLKKVVTSLDLYINYSLPGKFRNEELYKQSPVKIWVTPEEAEHMGYAEVKMHFQNGKLHTATVLHQGEEWKKEIDSLPAVFSTPIGVFTFSVADSTWQQLQPVPEVIQATVLSPNAAAASFRNRLAVTASNKSTTIAQLSLTDSEVARGTDFLNKLVDLYNEEGNNDKNEVAAKTAEFINERIHLINQELGTTESQLASFKQRAGVVDVTADATQAAGEQASYERAYAENEVQISLVQHLKNHILNETSQYEVIPANIGLDNSDLNTVVQNYNQMLIERKRLLRTSHEDNPAVQSLNASIEVMRNSVMGALQTAEKGLLINRQALQAQTRKFAGKVSDAPVQEKEYLSMSRQQEIQANLYLMLLQKREENNITLASTANNARVIDEPLAGGQIFPTPSQTYMIALVVGLALPIGVIFLWGLLQFKIQTRTDVEKITNLPIVGDIPLTDEASNSAIVVRENRNELMEEVFRAVRTNIQYMLTEGQKVILFTSTTSGEGKSFNAGNLACSFAFMGKKVVIVGLDIRKPGLNKVFHLSHKEAGISQYLANPEHTDLLSLCQVSTVSENLYILPGGTIPPNPTELVARKSLDTAIEILKQHFDYVILDTAPIGMVTDTQLVARVADLSVYVCRSNYTAKSEFKLINELKQDNKLPHPCILLNGIDMSKRETGSYYGYGKYGKYGRYGYGKKYGYGYGYGYGKENIKK